MKRNILVLVVLGLFSACDDESVVMPGNYLIKEVKLNGETTSIFFYGEINQIDSVQLFRRGEVWEVLHMIYDSQSRLKKEVRYERESFGYVFDDSTVYEYENNLVIRILKYQSSSIIKSINEFVYQDNLCVQENYIIDGENIFHSKFYSYDENLNIATEERRFSEYIINSGNGSGLEYLDTRTYDTNQNPTAHYYSFIPGYPISPNNLIRNTRTGNWIPDGSGEDISEMTRYVYQYNAAGLPSLVTKNDGTTSLKTEYIYEMR